MYTREVWVHWWRADDYHIFSRVEVKKFHLSPTCQPDPEFLEGESMEAFVEYALAA
jgi:hypothetical protein